MMAFYRKHQRMIGIFLICFILNDVSLAENMSREPSVANAYRATIEPEGRALFNPRIEYNSNQWIPVGHSDPLKNDPTFDYSPPTLDRVRYWHETNDDNNNSVAANYNLDEKSEILLLGVPIVHTMYPKNVHHTNSNAQDPKANNRRSSTYYPPEPARVLTPPPIQMGPNAYQTDFNHAPQPTEWNNDLPSDSYVDESASYLTVIKPKTSPNPYASTLYTKDSRDSIYHLAANVNSLEANDRRKAWIQSLLQREATSPPTSTTPQVILAYSPQQHISPMIKNKQRPFEQTTATYFITSTPSTPMTTTKVAPTSPPTVKTLFVPTRPPMYLIIQGHSKVKTYGIDKNASRIVKNDPIMVPVGGSVEPVVKHITDDVKDNIIQVKHLHKLHTTQAPSKSKTTPKPTKGLLNASMDSLFGLLNSSLGFALDDISTKETSEKYNKTNDITKDEHILKNATPFTITGPTTVRPVNLTLANGNDNR